MPPPSPSLAQVRARSVPLVACAKGGEGTSEGRIAGGSDHLPPPPSLSGGIPSARRKAGGTTSATARSSLGSPDRDRNGAGGES